MRIKEWIINLYCNGIIMVLRLKYKILQWLEWVTHKHR